MHAAIVDASQAALNEIAGYFAERGDKASLFTDAREALDCIAEDPSIDVLLTCLDVAPLSGLELCWEARLLSSVRRPLYIVVMSYTNNVENLAQALDCGADEFISKPVHRTELYARLRSAERLRKTQDDLLRLAERDTLTGLYNRRAFFERFNTALTTPRVSSSLAAIMFEIDDFHGANDAHGHQVGDQLLKAVAAEAAKIDGIVGRLGVEKFAAILPGRIETQALILSERLRGHFEKLSFETMSGPINMTCSFGISEWQEGDDPDTLLQRADVALCQAKSQGQNYCCVAGRTPVRSLLIGSGTIRSRAR